MQMVISPGDGSSSVNNDAMASLVLPQCGQGHGGTLVSFIYETPWNTSSLFSVSPVAHAQWISTATAL